MRASTATMTRQSALCAAQGSGAILRAQTPPRRVKTARQARILRRREYKQRQDAMIVHQVLFQLTWETMIQLIARPAQETRPIRMPNGIQAVKVALTTNTQIASQDKRSVQNVTQAKKCLAPWARVFVSIAMPVR